MEHYTAQAQKREPWITAEALVTEMLHGVGVPAHLKGYRYLREAVLLSLEDMSLLGAVTTVLYPRVAVRFDTTPSRVERAIRHAIEVAWEKGSLKDYPQLFGYPLANVTKPSNAEFIALIADELQLQRKSAERAQL